MMRPHMVRRLPVLPSNSLRRIAIALRRPAHSRHESSQTPPPKQISPHIGFYKDFGAPFGKVFLMAIFTYQVAYWTWTKLEKDELKSEKQSELTRLETKLKDLIETKKV